MNPLIEILLCIVYPFDMVQIFCILSLQILYYVSFNMVLV